MPMIPPQIFKSVNFTKTQKSRCFKSKTFFLQKKKKKKKKKKSLPPGKCFPQNVTSLPMRAKIVISPKAAEKCGGEDSKYS